MAFGFQFCQLIYNKLDGTGYIVDIGTFDFFFSHVDVSEFDVFCFFMYADI